MIDKIYILKSQIVLLINTIMSGDILILTVNDKPKSGTYVIFSRLYLSCDE